MTTHAVLSPSARHRWSACPASAREALKYPDSKSSVSAVDGTHTHTLLEHCLKTGLKPVDLIGNTLNDHDGEFMVDTERAERVGFALDYIYKRKQTTGADVQSEQTVHLQGRDDLSGTVDVLLKWSNGIEIIDYKDGVGEVEVDNNAQLRHYAVNVLSNFEITLIDTVTLTIIQPKLNQFGKSAIKTVTYFVGDFYNSEKAKLIGEAEATKPDDAPYVAGEMQCKWCPHGGNCGARATQVLEKAGITFGKTTVLVQSMELETMNLSNEKIRDIIEATPMIKQFLETVEEMALEKMVAGNPIDGLKVIKGRGTRSWSLPDEEIAIKLNKMTVPKGELWKTSLISPAQLEKLKWKNTKGEQKTLSAKQLGVVKSELISTSEGRLTVVSAADERPAVEFKPVEDMFVPDWMK